MTKRESDICLLSFSIISSLLSHLLWNATVQHIFWEKHCICQHQWKILKSEFTQTHKHCSVFFFKYDWKGVSSLEGYCGAGNVMENLIEKNRLAPVHSNGYWNNAELAYRLLATPRQTKGSSVSLGIERSPYQPTWQTWYLMQTPFLLSETLKNFFKSAFCIEESNSVLKLQRCSCLPGAPSFPICFTNALSKYLYSFTDPISTNLWQPNVPWGAVLQD